MRPEGPRPERPRGPAKSLVNGLILARSLLRDGEISPMRRSRFSLISAICALLANVSVPNATIADDKIFLTCTNGRSFDQSYNMQVCPPQGCPPLMNPLLSVSIVVDLRARTVNGAPIISLDETQIAAMGRGHINEDTSTTVLYQIDRMAGRLSVTTTLFPTSCETQKPCPFFRSSENVYDCSPAQAPKF